MLPSSGKICEFVVAENFKSWKCARKKQAGLREPKSRERDILIESTRYNELTYFPWWKTSEFYLQLSAFNLPPSHF